MSAALVALFDVLLLDLDGVVYRGLDAVPHAVETLTAVAGGPVRLGYVTNNASRTPAEVADQLRSFGLDVDDHDVVTSAQAGARLLRERLPAGARVLVVGGAGIRAALQDEGLVPVDTAADDPAAVLQGFAPEIGWRALAEGAYAVGRGVPWVATNTDLTIPTALGIAPGNGTLVAAVATATGRAPVVAGKPERPLMDESVRRLGATRPLVVGDRLDTDIEGARTAGLPSLLVLTGVTSAADLLAAPPHRRPDYVGDDLGVLREEYPQLSEVGTSWRCGGWEVVADGGRLVVTERGPRPVDGLRTMAPACWALGDTAPDREQLLAGAEAALGLAPVERPSSRGGSRPALPQRS